MHAAYNSCICHVMREVTGEENKNERKRDTKEAEKGYRCRRGAVRKEQSGSDLLRVGICLLLTQRQRVYIWDHTASGNDDVPEELAQFLMVLDN